jgi:hypothetical protein
MYWAGTVIFITLVVGYMSAYSWLLYNQRRTQIRIKDLPAVTAHVIHAGQRGLLIYEPTAKKSDRASSELEHLLKELKELKELISSNDSVGRGRIRLVLWSDILGFDLCPEADPRCEKSQLPLGGIGG